MVRISPGDEVVLVVHSAMSEADVHTWHSQQGHLNIDAVLEIICKGMARRMEIVGTPSRTANPCDTRLKGKQTRAEIQKMTETRADEILGRVFSDI